MSPSEPVPPEVTAIAVALVALWQAEEMAGADAVLPGEAAGYRWS